MWDRIPKEYKQSLTYTDFYHAYAHVVPSEQHRPCPKQDGQTNHIERLNLTLRQRIARLVRKTLSFSKKLLPHLYALRLFFVQHNQQAGQRYLTSIDTTT